MLFFERSVRLSLILGFFLVSCSSKEKDPSWPFEKLAATNTGIDFINKVENTEDFNIFLYRNFYNGAGVGIGDINNDGLPDIYFTSNMGANSLYLNKGNFKFENITEKAGVASNDKWSTGVSIVDINADGWLDIYVCNAGFQKGKDQKNELYINNGDLTFTEEAGKYGLDDNGYSTHAAFFDYDKDGDLDVYILNNSFMPVNTLNYSNKRSLPANEWPVKDFLKGGGDKFFRNDGGHFQDVTIEAGIFSSLIGFGLGITVGDVDGDGWEDVYISNDFFERDYLYINQKDGTFREKIKEQMRHISAFSMGADMADIDNDGRLDIFVTDMLPSDPVRLKTTSSFEDYNIYQLKLERDFYHQYMHNTLQLNRGDGLFSEIAHFSGTSRSDWSWGALMFDIDNDGFKDIYVSNGIYHDVTNQDFIDFFANDAIMTMALSGKKPDVDKIVSRMPSVPLRNKVFMNKGDLTFADISEVAHNEPSFSNGAAYADLDNDGDMDLVINNVNQQAFILKNLTRDKTDKNFLKVRLTGSGQNPFAIGTKVTVFGSRPQVLVHMPFRGFQSSSSYDLLFGIAENEIIDSVVIVWPDLTQSVIPAPSRNSVVDVSVNDVSRRAIPIPARAVEELVEQVPSPFDAHQEDTFADYYNEGLVIKMLSREGPKAAIGDVNGDNREDLYIAGARNQPGQLYLQGIDGFYRVSQKAFERDSGFEDTACIFLDADGDGDLDLLTGSGGNFSTPGSREMQDRLYINDGNGNFTLKPDAFPNNGYNTGVLLPVDFDADGDMDVFVGSRSVPGNYGVPPRNFLYRNDGNATFENVIREVAPELEYVGMVTDAALMDVDRDGKPELIIVGEWMSPKIFSIGKSEIARLKTNLSGENGWWSSILVTDIDNDGDDDLILGNRGENFYFSASHENPAKLWVYDFDSNNTLDKIITTGTNGKDFPVHVKRELTQQINSLRKRNLKHAEFATKSMEDLFEKEDLKKALVFNANNFKSVIAVNGGNMQFSLHVLPDEIQLSCINSIASIDLNDDGVNDLIMVGNRSGFLPQYSKLDANFGSVLIGDGKGSFRVASFEESGFRVTGDVTQILTLNIGDTKHILCLINDGTPKLFRIRATKNGGDIE